MSYQLYRNTTLGNTLQESLDELIQVKYTNIYLSPVGLFRNICWFLIVNAVRPDHTPAGLQGALAVRQVDQYGTEHEGEGARHLQGIEAEHLSILRQRLDPDAERRRIPGGARIRQGGQGEDRRL